VKAQEERRDAPKGSVAYVLPSHKFSGVSRPAPARSAPLSYRCLAEQGIERYLKPFCKSSIALEVTEIISRAVALHPRQKQRGPGDK